MRSPGIYLGIGRNRGGASGPNGAPNNLVLTVNAKDGLSASFSSTSTNQDGYRAYVSTGGTFVANNTSATTTINLTGLTVGQFYQVKIVAYKGTAESDPCNTIIETWSQGLMRSYLNINSHATWTSAQIALIQGRLEEQYVIDTFGPLGTNKTVCDFFVFLQSQAVAHSTATNTKSGATIRWNFGGGNIYSQNNFPNQTSTTEISFTSTDGFGGVTALNIGSNKCYGNIPNVPYYFPNALTINIAGGATVSEKYTGDISAWNFNNNATNIGLSNNFLSGDLKDWLLPDKITVFTCYSNPYLIGKSPSLKATWGNVGGTPITYSAYDCCFTGIGDRLWQKCGSYQMTPVIRLDGNCLSSSIISQWLTDTNTWYQTHAPYSSAASFSPKFTGVYNGTIIDGDLNADLIALKAVFVAASKTFATTFFNPYTYLLTPLDKGTLVISDDDIFASAITQEYIMMNARGKHGTGFVNVEFGGVNLTLIQVQQMLAGGWDMQGHPDFNSIPADATAIRASCQAYVDLFSTNSLGTLNHIAYGGGFYNALIKSIMPEYFLSARKTSSDGGSYLDKGYLVYKDSDKYAIPGLYSNYANQADCDSVKGIVRLANLKNAGIVLYIHSMTDSNTAYLAQVVDYAISLGMDVKTYSELYAKIIA